MNEPVPAAFTFDDAALTAIDPRHIAVTRIAYAALGLILIIGAGLLEFAISPLPGLFILPAMAVALYTVFIMPARKYRRWGYQMGGDGLRIVSGYLFHCDTLVPFGRIQHIDVDQGPVQRPYGLATLTIYTAGNHNSAVALPGLAHADALAMREAIRAHIKRDLL